MAAPLNQDVLGRVMMEWPAYNGLARTCRHFAALARAVRDDFARANVITTIIDDFTSHRLPNGCFHGDMTHQLPVCKVRFTHEYNVLTRYERNYMPTLLGATYVSRFIKGFEFTYSTSIAFASSRIIIPVVAEGDKTDTILHIVIEKHDRGVLLWGFSDGISVIIDRPYPSIDAPDYEQFADSVLRVVTAARLLPKGSDVVYDYNPSLWPAANFLPANFKPCSSP